MFVYEIDAQSLENKLAQHMIASFKNGKICQDIASDVESRFEDNLSVEVAESVLPYISSSK
jgi:hypothetical protein